MARYSYGGQALIEGVLMRGRDAIAVALRHPDGRILWADERLGVGFRGTAWAKLPLIRGLVVLYETLVVGTRWLLRAASVAAAAEEIAGPAPAKAASSNATTTVAAVAAEPATSLAADAVGATVGAPAVAAPAVEAPAVEAIPGEASQAVSAQPAASASAGPDGADLGKGAVALMLGITMVLAVGLFFFLPLFLATLITGGRDAIQMRIVEALIQVALFIGYLTLIGRTADVHRTFMYHGAEHMTIHALEAGDPLRVDAVRRYPTAHPRCGTEFLVVVILVSIVVFGIVGKLDLPYMVLSRIVLIPVIAAISYELLRFGARHRGRVLIRWLFQPGIWVQMITTKQPTDDMIEVAIVSMEQAMLADGEPLPPGSGAIARAPLSLGGSPVSAVAPEA
jgi:uncharacterized protein YqhQ